MQIWQTIKQPPWRIIVAGFLLLLIFCLAYLAWSPGLDVLDGRHDRERNAIWISHGWLGSDAWFIRNAKTNEYSRYRDPSSIRNLVDKSRRHDITNVFPHLCPAESDGHLPKVDAAQTERFLDVLDGFRVMPGIGGPNGSSVRLRNARWRSTFASEVSNLLLAHPRFSGVHLNVEPLASGETNFLVFLEELRSSLPPGKLLSVAAYPPPTRWHPYNDLHWEQNYFREVARRCDQLAVMMYDVGQRVPKMYQWLMADWTQEVLVWSEDKPVLLGVPTYDDFGVEYHHPDVENLTNALLGVHRGLSRQALPGSYQGVAIYCDWETSETEWTYFENHFLDGKQRTP